jgi:hypothetical protein
MDDSFDAPRQSLLDVVQEKLHKQRKTIVYSRIVLVAALDSKVSSKNALQVRCGHAGTKSCVCADAQNAP